jgi:hypothetical protein
LKIKFLTAPFIAISQIDIGQSLLPDENTEDEVTKTDQNMFVVVKLAPI